MLDCDVFMYREHFKCMMCTVCMKYSISCACTYVLYQSDSSCVGTFGVFSVLYVYALCSFVCVCVVFPSMKLLHTPVPVVVGSSLSCTTLLSIAHH